MIYLMMKRYWWLAWLMLWPLMQIAAAAEIQVGIDRNPVNLNDSFQLTFTASDEPDGDPDFTPLQENFQILNQQRSSNSSWVNGKSSRTEQWVLHLMAKGAGEVLIPPIAFGADSSKPLKLTVTETSDSPQNDDEIFLEVSATPDKPYVQSQVLYTLKLYRRVQITQASLNEPEIKDALVEKLGEDSTYSTQLKGVDYWVTERKYAIFPQQSGSMTIAPLTLNAEFVSSQRPRFNGFFNRPTTETRRVSSKAITLNVQAVPVAFKADAWLSAESLQLSQNWSDSSLQTKVGEPLTRTIRITAKGSTVGQLPELTEKAGIDGIKTYPDQPLLKEDKQSDGLTALREEKLAFIPSKPGEYTLPAVEVHWFNTKTNKAETASLPSVTIRALDSGVDNQSSAAPAITSPLETLSPPSPVPTDDNSDSRFWQMVSGVLALGWLATLLWLWLHRRSASKPVELVATASKPTLNNSAEKALKSACLENKPQAAKQALLQWGKAQCGADNLGALAGFYPGRLAEEINILNRLLYSGHTQHWQGQSLWKAFDENRQSVVLVKTVKDDGLEPLYKI